MIRRTYAYLSLFVVASLLLSGCGDSESALSKEKTKAALEEINSRLPVELTTLEEGSGTSGIDQLFTLTNSGGLTLPFGRVKPSSDKRQVREHLKTGIYAIRHALHQATIAGRVKGEEPFDYNASKGVYTWNPNDEIFNKTGESNILEIRFPTAESITNNAVFKLLAYQCSGIYSLFPFS
jgi:biotin carboxylase